MDEGLHFEITGENESLKSVVQESERLMDDLGEKAEETGEKLKHIFESGSVMTDGSIKDMFKDFSLDEYVQEVDAFVAAGGDAANQAKVLDMALRSVQSALDAAPVDNTALVDELNGIVENIKAAKGALEAQVMKEAEAAGMNFSFSAGNSDILSQEEIEELERARNATKELAEAEQEYQDVVRQRSQLPQPPTGGGSGGNGGSGGGGNPPSNPPSTPTDNRSIKDIENEIESLDKTIDKVTSKQGEITAMFDSYRGADAAAMSIRGLNQANDEIGDGFAELGRAQDAYNTKIADLEALAQKQEQALQNIKTAQEQAFANGDSRGAAKALADYSASSGQLEQTRQRIEQTKEQAANLGAVIDNNADVQNRYNDVLDAAEFADATNDIGALQEAFDSEKNIMEDCEQEMNRMQEELEELQKQMASGKLTPDEQGAAQKKLDDLRNKIAEVASAYQNASDRAKQFGGKIGQSIPDNSSQPGGDNEKTAGAIGKVGGAAKDASTQLGKLRMNVTSITRGFSAMSKGGAGVVTGLASVGKGVLGLTAMVGSLGKALLGLLANPIVLAIAAVIAAIAALYKMIKKFINGTSDGADMFASWIGYIKGFKAAIDQFVMEVSRKVAEFVKSFGAMGSAIGSSLKTAWTWISSWGAEIINFFSALGDSLKNYLTAKISDIGGGIKNAWTKTKAWFKGEEVNAEDLVDTNSADGAFDGLKKAVADFGKTAKAEVASTREETKALWKEWTQGFSSFEMPSFKDFMSTYARIEELQRGIIHKQREWTVASAQLEQQQSDLQNQLDRAGNVDKLQTMVQLQDTIQKKYDGELSIARDELKVQQEINRLKGKNVSDDDLKKEADLTAKVMGIEQKRNNEVRALTNQHIDLTRQLEEERREQQRILANNTRDKEIAALQQQLKYEKDLTKQLEIQDQIRQKQLEKELEGINKQQQSTIKSSLGADAEQAFAKGANKEELKGLFVGNDAALAEIDRIFAYYNQLRDDAVSKSQQEGMFSNFDKELENMQKYVDETLAIEQERQDALREIAESGMSQREKDRQAEVVNGIAAEKQKIADKNAGFDKDGDQNGEMLANRLTSFGVSIADKTFEEIRELYQQFLGELGDDIQSLEQQNQAIDMYTSATSQLESGVGADGEELTEEQKVELERQKAEYGALLIQYGIEAAEVDNVRAENAKKLIALEQAKTMAEGTYVSAIEKQSRKESDQAVVSRARWNTTRDALALVGSTARSVSDTFGDYMSDSAKKAVDTVGSLVDIAMGAIDSISSFTKGTTEAMKVSSLSAAESIKTLEKASLILAIISAAIQAAMAIARLFMGKSAYEKAKEKVDAQIEVVKELKKAQEDLERTYKRNSGTKHYQDMAKAAQNYDNVIAEQQKAVRLSEEALDSAKSKEKKEAKQNLEDQQRALQEMKDAQYELYTEMQKELLTTDVTSFSENLADALVEGFEDGTGGIADTWDNVLNDLMKSMMKKQLSLALADMFKGTFDKFNDYVKDGQLTDAEMQTIMTELDAKSKQAESVAEQYQKMMSSMGLLDDANPEADKGGFQSMSQDTADELNARFTALQIEGAQVVTSTNAILEGMTMLQSNSDKTILFLQDIDRYQQLAYEQSQEHIEVIRIISDTVADISKHTARLKAIEQNTDRL